MQGRYHRQLVLLFAYLTLLVSTSSEQVPPSAAPGGKAALGRQDGPCKASEYTCQSGECVALDRYCDGMEDCQDKSDEPQFCSRK